jgi:flagellar hook assembly protein FlgD
VVLTAESVSTRRLPPDAGRPVRVIVVEELPDGDHALSWDGRDNGGSRVAAGTSFVKLVAGDMSHTRKVVYLGGR